MTSDSFKPADHFDRRRDRDPENRLCQAAPLAPAAICAVNRRRFVACGRSAAEERNDRRRNHGDAFFGRAREFCIALQLPFDARQQIFVFIGARPIEIELTKITLLPARANRRIRWFLECGW